MNRNIKFRVWDKNNNKFISRRTEFAILPNGKLIISKTDFYEYFENVNRQSDYIIQQFTGFVDKN
jgi:hypothetical protein